MIFYRIRKPSQKLASAPIVSEDKLRQKCQDINEECHGVHSSYEIYKYKDKSLTNVYDVKVVSPYNFENCSLPNLMKEAKI